MGEPYCHVHLELFIRNDRHECITQIRFKLSLIGATRSGQSGTPD